MSEEDVRASEETSEKEIILEDVVSPEVDTAHQGRDMPSSPVEVNDEKTKKFKYVEQKQVVDLTDDERSLIVANAKNGIDQPYFNVKFFKNGKYRIVKKKEEAPTVAQKAIKTTPHTNADGKVYYSDNQLLFEHIIELNSKVDKLMSKHKKLKRKYQTLQNDLYVDEEDVVSPEVKNDIKDEQSVESNKELNTTSGVAKVAKEQDTAHQGRVTAHQGRDTAHQGRDTEYRSAETHYESIPYNPQSVRRNWRSQIKYI